MTLNITIAPESEQFLREHAASSGEDISRVAGKWVDQMIQMQRQTQSVPANSNSLENQPLPENMEERTKLAHALLEQYKLRQGHIVSRPIEPPGISDRWPPGESVEDFLHTIQKHNDASQPRVFS